MEEAMRESYVIALCPHVMQPMIMMGAMRSLDGPMRSGKLFLTHAPPWQTRQRKQEESKQHSRALLGGFTDNLYDVSLQ
eukprot:1160451-Pelagomonas_calceolata.AAC.9